MAKIIERIAEYPPIMCNSYRTGLITRRYSSAHSGIDSCTIAGLDVCTICAGTVQRVYKSITHGNCLEYGYDGVTVRYCHMAKITVKVGQQLPKARLRGKWARPAHWPSGFICICRSC